MLTLNLTEKSLTLSHSYPVRRARSLLLCLGLLVGCSQSPYLDDDEGGQHLKNPDSLSLPYAAGTKVRITLQVGEGGMPAGWQLRSDNPAVLTVGALDSAHATSSSVAADCTAMGPGDTVLHMLDSSGSERHAVPVQVMAADSLKVYAHGPLRLIEQQTEAGAASAEVHEARVLTGGTGVFGILYFHGGQRLYGRGIVQFDQQAQLTVTNKTTSGSAATEWLFINPQADGDRSLALRVGTATLLTLPVSAVPESQIGSLGLLQQKVTSPKNDDQLWVLLQTKDMSGRDIFGVYGSWKLNGTAQQRSDGNMSAMGDLYRYHYADGNNQTLVASHGTIMASNTISASTGVIYDTTFLGCAMGGRTPAGAAWAPLVVLAALGLGLMRRRLRAGLPSV